MKTEEVIRARLASFKQSQGYDTIFGVDLNHGIVVLDTAIAVLKWVLDSEE